jgi:membrane-associated phospholipid phosphatase
MSESAKWGSRAAKLAAAAAAVGIATTAGQGRTADDGLFHLLNADWGSAQDRFSRGITELGSIWASAGAAAVLAVAGRPRAAADSLGAAGAMWVVGQAAKKVFRRLRPFDRLEGGRHLIDPPHGTSWPSSHPAVLLAFVVVAGRDLGLSSSARALLAGLAGVVGLSRIRVGVHYPADVAGGLLLGSAVAEAWSGLVSPRLARSPGAVERPVQ